MDRRRGRGPAADPELRRARVAVSVVFAVCGAGFSTWAARVPAVQERLGAGTGQLAVGLTALAAGSVLALLAAGPLVTAIGSRGGVRVGASALCAGLALVGWSPDPAVVTAALFVLGAGNSVLDVAMNAHAARVEAAYDRPVFAGFHAFWNVGGLAGSGLAALAGAGRVPVTVHLPVVAVLLLTTALTATGVGFLGGPDAGQGGPAFALPSRGLLALGVVAFAGFLAEGTVNDWSAAYLRRGTGSSAAVAALAYFAFSLTMVVVRLVADRLVTRVGPVRVVRGAAVTTAAGFALVLLVPRTGAALVAFAVIGLGVSAVVPLAWSAAGRAQPRAPGRAIAAVATCGYAGFLVGPAVVGSLATATDLRTAVGCVGAVALPVYLLAPALRVGLDRSTSAAR